MGALPILCEDDLSRELRLDFPEELLSDTKQPARVLLEAYEHHVETWITKIEKMLNHLPEDPTVELQEVRFDLSNVIIAILF